MTYVFFYHICPGLEANSRGNLDFQGNYAAHTPSVEAGPFSELLKEILLRVFKNKNHSEHLTVNILREECP